MKPQNSENKTIRVRLAIGKTNLCYKLLQELNEEERRVWAISAMNVVISSMSGKLFKPEDLVQKNESINPAVVEKKKVKKDVKPPEESGTTIAKFSGLNIAGFTKNVNWG